MTAVDRAGNRSPERAYVYKPRPTASQPAGGWDFDEGSGTTASGVGPVLTLGAGASFGGGWSSDVEPSDFGLHLTGAATARASATTAPLQTQDSFTVLARVLVPDATKQGVVVAQGSGAPDGFVLQIVTKSGAPYLRLTIGGTSVDSVSPVPTGQWSQIAVAYNAPADQALVLVEGQADFVASGLVSSTTASGAVLRVGGGVSGATTRDLAVDSIRVHHGYLARTEITTSFATDH